MEGQEENQAPAMPARLVDASGKPFIQAEELTERLAAVIDGCAVDYAIGFAAVFGALEQLKAQYVARVALKVSAQSPADVLAAHEAVGNLQAQRAIAAAEFDQAQKASRGSIEKRLAAKQAPRVNGKVAAAVKKVPRKLQSVK